MDDILAVVAKHLRQAETILFITGAGLSADSGLPTYRGIGGLYESGLTEEGLSIELLLSGQMLKMRPALTWKYIWEIGKARQGAVYNRGHKVIAEVEQEKPNTWVVTQNIDGLHWAAGSRNLTEVHGRVEILYCIECGYRVTVGDLFFGYTKKIDLPPTCPDCGGLIRPDVVLFDEYLSQRAMEDLARLSQMLIDLVFSIGTSSRFPYITQPVLFARELGIPTVEINPDQTDISATVDYRLPMRAAEALDQLWSRVQNKASYHHLNCLAKEFA